MDSQDSATDTDADTSKTAKEKESIADREQAFKKRHDDQVTKEKKEADAAKAAATKADSCKRMKEYKATLDSGQRVLQPDANGNRSFMSDEKRAQESATVNQNLSDCN